MLCMALIDHFNQGFIDLVNRSVVGKPVDMNQGNRKFQLLLSKTKHSTKGGRDTGKLTRRMERVKVEIKEISKEQESIRKGQREVKEKIELIDLECHELRRETDIIIRQSLNTQLRLCLMFQILKAREKNNFTKAASLTLILREVIAKQSKAKW